MKYATKLNLNVPMPFLGKAKVVVGQHMRQTHGFSKPKLVRKYLPKKQVELVRAALPDKIKKGFLGINLTEVRLLAPHIHTEEESIINFYIEADGEKTAFWEGEIIPDNLTVSDNGNGYINLCRDGLKEVEYFVAKPSDVWLMNTRIPHSVGYFDDARDSNLHFDPLNNNKRLLVQAYFSISYDKMVDALQHQISE